MKKKTINEQFKVESAGGEYILVCFGLIEYTIQSTRAVLLSWSLQIFIIIHIICTFYLLSTIFFVPWPEYFSSYKIHKYVI